MKTITQLAQGNPGAANFIMELEHQKVPLEVVLKIETSGIEGTDLYVLWSDLCERDMSKVIKLVGNCPLDVLKDACSRQDYSGRVLVAEYLN